METPQDIAKRAVSPRGKGLIRISLLVAAAVAVVVVASLFGIARDYAYLHATLLTGTPMGNYYALGEKLAGRARRGPWHARRRSDGRIGRQHCPPRGQRKALFHDVRLRARGDAGSAWRAASGAGASAGAGVAPAVRQAGAHVPDLCRAARRIDRHWTGRIGHRLPDAPTFRRRRHRESRRAPRNSRICRAGEAGRRGSPRPRRRRHGGRRRVPEGLPSTDTSSTSPRRASSKG